MVYSSEGDDKTSVPASNMEPDTGNAPVAANETPAFDTPVNIRVISYRKRNHDPDGISAKAVLDGLVATGILADDSTKQVKSITFESRKATEDEKTVIILEDDLQGRLADLEGEV